MPPSSGCSTPMATRPRRRSEHRQPLVGRAAGLQSDFQLDLQALRAAHILPVAAAGNAGAVAGADNSPANLPEAFAVGAAADATTIAPFSSRGRQPARESSSPRSSPRGTGIRSTGLGGVDAMGPRDLVRRAARGGRARAAAPGRPTADPCRAGDSAHGERHRPRRAGADSTFGAGLLDLIGAARQLHPRRPTSTLPRCRPQRTRTRGSRSAPMTRCSSIAAGEWWADADPGIGAGQPLTAADGLLDSRSEGLVASTAALRRARTCSACGP